MSSVSKQSPIRPARQTKKSAGKTTVVRKTAPRRVKPVVVVASGEDDLSNLVPPREVLSAVLKVAKVDPEWLDDAYTSAKPKKK